LASDLVSAHSTSTPKSITRKRRLSDICLDASAVDIRNASTTKFTSRKRVHFATSPACDNPISAEIQSKQCYNSTASHAEDIKIGERNAAVDNLVTQLAEPITQATDDTICDPKTSTNKQSVPIVQPSYNMPSSCPTPEAESLPKQQTIPNVSVDVNSKNGTPSLGPVELQIMLGPHRKPKEAWLNDVIINAAQSLLRQKYPHDYGLQDTILVNAGYVHLDDPSKPFVQVIFDPDNKHWITITNRGAPSK
jgi:hypothetical protein